MKNAVKSMFMPEFTRRKTREAKVKRREVEGVAFETCVTGSGDDVRLASATLARAIDTNEVKGYTRLEVEMAFAISVQPIEGIFQKVCAHR